VKQLTSSSRASAALRNHPSALVFLGDPQSAKRAIARVIGHLGPGQKPLVWAPGEQSLCLDPELEAFSRCAAVRTPQSPAAWHGGPVLALWPESCDLAELAHDGRVTALCVLGRRTDQRDNVAWVAATGATVLNAGGVPPARPHRLHPVVIEALRTLTSLVDHQNQLTASMDRRHAVVTLSTLRHGGYRLDPEGIRAWALAAAWPAGGARRLGELATKVQAGVALRARGFDSYPRPELLRLWCDGATAGHI
jgi:hypothetical protein